MIQILTVGLDKQIGTHIKMKIQNLDVVSGLYTETTSRALKLKSSHRT